MTICHLRQLQRKTFFLQMTQTRWPGVKMAVQNDNFFANNLDHLDGPAVEKRKLRHKNLSSYFDHLNGLGACKEDDSVQFAIVSRDVHLCILERGVLFMTPIKS